ncbi:hypothetical protein HPB49_021640 [Dermacentor silvarum]|uniref:Uncharacterized protein n=1 Tax=Dermacentor silvarum TaxID=543639 RepID=A0ACB8C5M9_DERSI|nr:uncharacterized protein LOC119463933 [Dermacentor silvarum]KAH7934125.1 hypothetical protein HPB49_021640 [Dermacentor silvarum]
MPYERDSYKLFGFSEELDWKPLHLVQPIDDARVCSACGFVPKRSGFLPCRHVLCEPCYEQCKNRGHICVMDGEACPETGIHWREFPVDKLFNREVSCWNKAYGCETITTVSNLVNHFHEKCAHHSTRCHKCSATVLQRDMIAHLESSCSAHVLSRKSSTSSSEGIGRNEIQNVQTVLHDIKQCLQNATTEHEHLSSRIGKVLGQRLDAQSELGDVIREMAERINLTLRVIEENVKRDEEVQREFDALKATLEERVADTKLTMEAFVRAQNSQAELRSKAQSDVTQTVSDMHREVQRIKSELENIQHELC